MTSSLFTHLMKMLSPTVTKSSLAPEQREGKGGILLHLIEQGNLTLDYSELKKQGRNIIFMCLCQEGRATNYKHAQSTIIRTWLISTRGGVSRTKKVTNQLMCSYFQLQVVVFILRLSEYCTREQAVIIECKTIAP